MKEDQIFFEIKKRLGEILPKSHCGFLFGSFAKGTAMRGSDVDIAIEGPSPLPFEIYLRLKQALEDIPTLRKIDLVDLPNVSSRFREEVLTYATSL